MLPRHRYDSSDALYRYHTYSDHRSHSLSSASPKKGTVVSYYTRRSFNRGLPDQLSVLISDVSRACEALDNAYSCIAPEPSTHQPHSLRMDTIPEIKFDIFYDGANESGRNHVFILGENFADGSGMFLSTGFIHYIDLNL